MSGASGCGQRSVVAVVKMTVMDSTYQLSSLSTEDAASLRAMGGVEYVADSRPGFPCRHCLCDAEIGEELILVSHDPFRGDSPYRSASPMFLHKFECVRPTFDAMPASLTARQLSVRAFDEHEMMVDAAITDGDSLGVVIERLFTDEASVRLDVHNSPRGCWAVTVDRL
jgi:hypothetical protein